MSIVTEGYKNSAKALGIRIAKSPDKGTLLIEVPFKFQEDGKDTILYWQGWLTENAIGNTMKTLVEIMDYNGEEETVDVPEGHADEGKFKNQNAINLQKEYSLKVVHEEYKEKTRARIAFVNNVGGGFQGVSPVAVKSALGALGWKAEFLAAKQAAGKPAAPKEEQKQQGADPFNESNDRPAWDTPPAQKALGF